jgi:hypothetical protein
VKPFTVKSYWKSYKGLPKKIQRDADRLFDLWKKNPSLAVRNEKSVIWYWIGDHNKYERLLKAL